LYFFLLLSRYRAEDNPTKIDHGELQSKTQTTRQLMATALDKRGLIKRYGPPAWTDNVDDGVCRMHDVGLMMHPRYSSLFYVTSMVRLYSHASASEATIDRRANQVKNKILHLFKELVIICLRAAIEENDDASNEGGGGAAAASAESHSNTVGSKRKAAQTTIEQSSGKRGRQEAAEMDDVFGKTDEPEHQEEENDLSTKAQKVMDNYLKDVNNNNIGERYTIKETILYWKNVGESLFPVVAQVALSVLAFPGGSGNLERDFCKSGNLITPMRASMDYRYECKGGGHIGVETILLLTTIPYLPHAGMLK